MKRRQFASEVTRIYDRLRQVHRIGGALLRAQEAEEIADAAYRLCERTPQDREAIAAWRAAAACKRAAQVAARHHTVLELAYPEGFWEDFARFRSGDAGALGAVISFLEADPWAHGTGYTKDKLIRSIKPPMLTPEYVTRLQRVVLHVVDTRDERDFRAYCRLARKVDAPELREQLTRRLADPDPNVRRRACWVLEALAQGWSGETHA